MRHRRVLPLDRTDIELNPVRAGMVTQSRDYRWSIWRPHALGAADVLVSEHALYRGLGRSAAERQKAN
jgi:putative transposase